MTSFEGVGSTFYQLNSAPGVPLQQGAHVNPPPPPNPTVTFAAPAAGSVLSGTTVGLDAVATAYGGHTITGVQFFIDGTSIGNGTLSQFGWTLSWDSTTVANQFGLLTATATDSASQTGSVTIGVVIDNPAAPPPAGLVMPIQGGGLAAQIDNTDSLESTAGINNWLVANRAAIAAQNNTVLVQPGTYWVDGPINVTGGITITAQDTTNLPVFHRHTLYPYRIKPDLRATISGVTNPAYNPNGRAGGWQYDALGGQASIPLSQSNPFQTGTASGEEFGGYDAKTTRSADGKTIIGLTALYGSPWGQGDVGSVIQYLVESGLNGTYQSNVASVAADGKSLLFVTPTPSTNATHEGGEGTVTWCRHTKGAGWKVEHQTNDLLSYYLGPTNAVSHPWSGYQRALLDAIENAAQAPIFQFADTSASVLDHLKVQHCNDGWRNSIVNFAKSYPVVTEGDRCVVSVSANQVVQNCEIYNAWGAGERGPAQLLNTKIHHCGMQACIGAMPNKTVDGCILYNTHHSLIDFESLDTIPNVTINNVTAGGPKGLLALSCVVSGLTVTNCHSTQADITAGTILSGATLFDTAGADGYNPGAAGGKNHLIDSNTFDFVNHIANPAMQIGGINSLTVTNNTIPTNNYFVDVRSAFITTIKTAPNPATTGTTLTVSPGAAINFSSPSFYALVWPNNQNPTPSNSEIIQVTAVSVDTLTIVRAQRGSSARAIVVGDQITQISVNVTVSGNAGGAGMLGQVFPFAT